jgi:hypothetical protein
MNAGNQYKWWGRATFIMPQPGHEVHHAAGQIRGLGTPPPRRCSGSLLLRGEHQHLQLACDGQVEAFADEDLSAAGHDQHWALIGLVNLLVLAGLRGIIARPWVYFLSSSSAYIFTKAAAASSDFHCERYSSATEEVEFLSGALLFCAA